MNSIINDALTVLNDLELNLGDIAGKLTQQQKQTLAQEIDRVVSELGQLKSTDGLTELDFAALANELIELINSYEPARQIISADDEIASARERAAQLAVLEKQDPRAPSRAARPAQSDQRATEQFEFLANQIVNQCQIIKKRLEE